MSPIEIIVIIAAVSIVAINIAIHFKKRIKGEAVGECANCHINKDKILKQYHKKYCKQCLNYKLSTRNDPTLNWVIFAKNKEENI